MRGRERLRLALAVLAVALGLAQPAGAHPVVEQGWPPGNRSGLIAGYSGFCVYGSVIQEHAWHDNTTSSTNCANYVKRWHRQYEQFYRQRLSGGGAEFCFDNGYHQSTSASEVFFNHWPWDAGNWCNFSGAWMNLYIDTWQAAWNGQAWVEGQWRPATKHCHCP
jgi:hypothetical protein